jgi:hypothetical protein
MGARWCNRCATAAAAARIEEVGGLGDTCPPVALARTEIPYRSQYASPELAGEIAAGRVTLEQDPRWREAGARDRQEYVRWARCGCGMACLQMILEARGGPAPPLVELGRRAIAYGGYEARPPRGFGPLVYAGFVDFAAAEFGLAARVAAQLPLDELLRAVAADEVVLASVSAEIRSLAAEPARRGGHLVLVIDCSADARRLCFHDPAGDRSDNARAVWLDRDSFARFYAERGIAVTLPRA